MVGEQCAALKPGKLCGQFDVFVVDAKDLRRGIYVLRNANPGLTVAEFVAEDFPVGEDEVVEFVGIHAAFGRIVAGEVLVAVLEIIRKVIQVATIQVVEDLRQCFEDVRLSAAVAAREDVGVEVDRLVVIEFAEEADREAGGQGADP